MDIVDKAGKPFDGGRTYRLTVLCDDFPLKSET